MFAFVEDSRKFIQSRDILFKNADEPVIVMSNSLIRLKQSFDQFQLPDWTWTPQALARQALARQTHGAAEVVLFNQLPWLYN